MKAVVVSVVMSAFSMVGCGSRSTAPPLEAQTPSPPPSSLRAVALRGRHAMQSAVVGPGGRIYVATMDELLVSSPEDRSVGLRVPFRGTLAATPSGSALFRFEERWLFEVQPSGADGRRTSFDEAIVALGFSRSGGLLRVTLRDKGAESAVVLRAADLGMIGRGEPFEFTRELISSTDDRFVALGNRVVDTRTGATVYQQRELRRAAMFFGDHHLFWLLGARFENVDLERGTSTVTTLPCAGWARAAPLQQHFVTQCDDETIITTLVGDTPSFEHLPPGTFVVDPRAETGREPPPSARVPIDPRFAADVAPRMLVSGDDTMLRDGEIVAAEGSAAGASATRVRIGPPGMTALASREEPQRVASQDGRFVVVMTPGHVHSPAMLQRLDARSGAVESSVELADPSYRSSRLLGLVGERLVLMPSGGVWAEVVLLDARTFDEKERYFFGKGSMLHVREDGTYETSGDAAQLENLVLCVAGDRFVPVSRCAKRAL